jgi:hypothetical protein
MWTFKLLAVSLIACCATVQGQCYINAAGQTVCPNRPAIYGATHPFQTRVQVTPQMTRYAIAAPQSVSYGSTGGYQSVRAAGCNCINCTCGSVRNVRDITLQRAAELKELGQLRAYKATTAPLLKALRAECSALRANNAQPGAARVPTQEPAGVWLPINLTIPKVSLRLPPSTGLTLPQTLLAVQ